MQSEQKPDITSIRMDDLEKLQIDDSNNLYWNGKKIQTTVEVRLERWSKWAAIFGASGVVVSSIISLIRASVDFYRWLCA
jgi:hypothetical protein